MGADRAGDRGDAGLRAGGRRAEPGDARPEGAGPALAARLARQVTEEGSGWAYLLSGAPVTRRVARLRRNLGERLTCARFGTVREMADALLAEASIRPMAVPARAEASATA